MKSSLLALLIITLFVSCKNDKEDMAYPVTKRDVTQSLNGTWELSSFYNYVDNKVSDSFNPVNGYRQVKMYTQTKVMWSKHVPSDSTEWFGYGSYKIEGNNLMEVLDYGSKMMSKIIQERKEFVYELDVKKNKFSQIEIDEEGNRIYSENYRRIE